MKEIIDLEKIWNKWKRDVLSFKTERVILSRVQRSHSTHCTLAAPYTHVRRNRLLFARRQSGIFKLHVGCVNTQRTDIFRPVPQGPGQDEWHTTTRSEKTASAGNQTRISRSQAIGPFLTPGYITMHFDTLIEHSVHRLTFACISFSVGL